MKTLKNFLFRGLIYESTFQSADYTKHDFKYAKGVINDLLNSSTILLGKNGETEHQLDPKDQEAFRTQYDSSNFPKTSKEFDDMLANYLSFPKWNMIYKGKYSGKSTNTKGQRAEGLVCYMFNEANADIEAFKAEVMPDLDDAWIQSSQWTVEFMNKQTGVADIAWTSDNYVACRVDGGDFRLDSKYSFATEVTSIFSGTKAMKKIFGVNCNDLYSGQKDIWNKADILLVHKEMGKTLIDEIKEKGIANGEMLNTCLIEYTKQGVIIPISLKQLENPNAHLSSVNLVKGEPVDMIESVKHIRIADRYAAQYTGNVDIVCNGVDGKEMLITFRSDTNGKNGLSVEPKEIGGTARYGKAVAIIRGILGLKKQDFYIVKNSNDDAIKEFKNYGFDVTVKLKSNYDTVEPPFRERACCAGLLGVLKAYHEKTKEPIDKDFPVKFANFCMFCAVGLSGKGAFYKIAN